MIDGRTCRAARGFLNWTSRMLSAKSGVPVSRVFELERDRPVGEDHLRRLEAVFLRHGVAIVADGIRATTTTNRFSQDPFGTEAVSNIPG